MAFTRAVTVEAAQVESFQIIATDEHVAHVGHLAGVEATSKTSHFFANTEHVRHVGHLTGVYNVSI